MAGTAYTRGKGGRFAGSVGTGKTAVPTAASAPLARPPADYVDTPRVNDLYSRFIEMRTRTNRVDPQQAEMLERYGVDADDLPEDIDEDTIESALGLLEQVAAAAATRGHYSYAEDTSDIQSLAASAYEALGYGSDDAEDKARDLAEGDASDW